jgi:excisionase family DNA binding protein
MSRSYKQSSARGRSRSRLTLDSVSVFTLGEAAEILRISEDTASSLVSRGDLPALRMGRCIRISQRALVDFIAGTVKKAS